MNVIFDNTSFQDNIIIGEEQKYINMGIPFDDWHEAYMECVFHDGYAEVIGHPQYKLVYPTIEQVKNSQAKIKAITEYTGIHDSINFHDIALKYADVVLNEEYFADVKGLYKATDKQIKLTLAITTVMDVYAVKTFNIEDEHIKTREGLEALYVERENTHCMILVHWKPKRNISCRQDPYCPAFMLSTHTLEKIWKHMNKTLCFWNGSPKK